MKSNVRLRSDFFFVNVFVLAVVFRQEISRNQQFGAKLLVSEICRQNTTASTETFTEK